MRNSRIGTFILRCLQFPHPFLDFVWLRLVSLALLPSAGSCVVEAEGVEPGSAATRPALRMVNLLLICCLGIAFEVVSGSCSSSLMGYSRSSIFDGRNSAPMFLRAVIGNVGVEVGRGYLSNYASS